MNEAIPAIIGTMAEDCLLAALEKANLVLSLTSGVDLAFLLSAATSLAFPASVWKAPSMQCKLQKSENRILM